jgi:hypothetical protein
MSEHIIARSFLGKQIRHRADGFMSLTDMAACFGKLVGDWNQLKGTKAFLKVLANKHYGNCHNGPIESNVGGTPEAKPSPIVLTVQATALGISQAEIGNGTQLGKYIVARGFVPLGKSQHGKYPVNFFEPSEALNAAILNYYDRSPIELAVVA